MPLTSRRLFSIELLGARELERALNELPKRIGKAAIRRALKKAARPIADDAKRRVAIRSGELQRRIMVSTKLSRRQKRYLRGRGVDPNRVDVFIGTGPERHAHLVEFGTGPRRHKSGKSVGSMPAQPFMRPAWEAGKMKAFREIGMLMWIEIEKGARNLAKRRAKAGR